LLFHSLVLLAEAQEAEEREEGEKQEAQKGEEQKAQEGEEQQAQEQGPQQEPQQRSYRQGQEQKQEQVTGTQAITSSSSSSSSSGGDHALHKCGVALHLLADVWYGTQVPCELCWLSFWRVVQHQLLAVASSVCSLGSRWEQALDLPSQSCQAEGLLCCRMTADSCTTTTIGVAAQLQPLPTGKLVNLTSSHDQSTPVAQMQHPVGSRRSCIT
jgi:hypothetical protein